SGTGGGGIRNDANLTLTSCVVSGCVALGQTQGAFVGGGAILNTGSLQMLGCTLSGNTAQGGNGPVGIIPGGNAYGGALSNRPGSTATLRNCTIMGNRAIRGLGSCIPICQPQNGSAAGGAIDNEGDLIVESCTIVLNSTLYDTSSGSINTGGGVMNTAGT